MVSTEAKIMLDRYTEDARRVIFFARYEASRLGAPILESEHLWLGLLRESKKAVKRLAPGVTLEAIHERLTRHGLNAQRVSMTVDIPLSDEAKRAIAGAAAEADSRGQKHVTPDYLILALVREQGESPSPGPGSV
jgi:ATP-dependent Clp protease ATP-binding subunit ClpC